MVKNITENDMNLIEEIAKKYEMSLGDLGKAIVAQTKKKTVKQIRFTQEEYEFITDYIRTKGGTYASFCEWACEDFIGLDKHKNIFMELRGYGQNRNKRVNVYFKDKSLEDKVEDTAIAYGVEIGLIIRYCVIQKISDLTSEN